MNHSTGTNACEWFRAEKLQTFDGRITVPQRWEPDGFERAGAQFRPAI